jgi:hypothetical protein
MCPMRSSDVPEARSEAADAMISVALQAVQNALRHRDRSALALTLETLAVARGRVPLVRTRGATTTTSDIRAQGDPHTHE